MYSPKLNSIFIPFFIFTFITTFCDDEEPEECGQFQTSTQRVFRLNERSSKSVEVITKNARAECNARFIVEFGWEEKDKFLSSNEKSPMEESFAGLKLTFRETAFNNTFLIKSVSGIDGKLNPDNERGFVWVIEIPVDPVASTGDTKFMVEIEHDILDTDFDFFVDVKIEYAEVL